VSEDSNGQTVIAIAYEIKDSGKVYIDLWKPAYFPE
jgi:hypothetical protein